VPLYEYQCDTCGQRFEVIQKFSDPPVDVCKSCGKGPVTRLMSSPAIQFKGSGWYITDYAKKNSTSSTSTGDSTKSDTAKSETKTDTAPAKTEATPAKKD
jgi:putative FmdB family regulatory protein